MAPLPARVLFCEHRTHTHAQQVRHKHVRRERLYPYILNWSSKINSSKTLHIVGDDFLFFDFWCKSLNSTDCMKGEKTLTINNSQTDFSF